MSDEELDVTEVVLRDGWAVGNPITKIDMEFLASAADAITALRAQRDEALAEVFDFPDRKAMSRRIREQRKLIRKLQVESDTRLRLLMEPKARADRAELAMREAHHQRDTEVIRRQDAEAALAAQIEVDAGLIDLIAAEASKGVLLGSAQDQAVLDMMKSLSAAIRAQPHSTTTLDRVKAQVRAEALRKFEQSRANGERVQLGDDGKLDEIVSCGTAHLEHMGGQSWFLSMGFADGSEHCVWLKGKITMEERREPPALLDKECV